MTKAILNKPTPAWKECTVRFLDRTPIHFDTALWQQAKYTSTLRKLGVQVEMLEINQNSPDGVFVEADVGVTCMSLVFDNE